MLNTTFHRRHEKTCLVVSPGSTCSGEGFGASKSRAFSVRRSRERKSRFILRAGMSTCCPGSGGLAYEERLEAVDAAIAQHVLLMSRLVGKADSQLDQIAEASFPLWLSCQSALAPLTVDKLGS